MCCPCACSTVKRCSLLLHQAQSKDESPPQHRLQLVVLCFPFKAATRDIAADTSAFVLFTSAYSHITDASVAVLQRVGENAALRAGDGCDIWLY